jgi:hypothetical protein
MLDLERVLNLLLIGLMAMNANDIINAFIRKAVTERIEKIENLKKRKQ